MLGDIPLDVWYDNPLQVAQDKKPVTGGAGKANGADKKASDTAGESAVKAPAAEPETKSAGGDDWAALLDKETLENEVKQVKQGLANAFMSVNKYNANYKGDIPMHGSVLAVLAELAGKLPESVSWKEKAPQVRDLAADVVNKSKGLGAGSFDPAKKTYDTLTELLSGNTPPDLPQAAPSTEFSEVAKRSGLMKRMDKAHEWMKQTVTTEEAFKKNSEEVLHQARMLAVLSKVVGAPGYNSTDEEDYQGFVKRMVDANKQIIQAAKEGNFAAYSDASNKNQRNCDECHSSYRFE